MALFMIPSPRALDPSDLSSTILATHGFIDDPQSTGTIHYRYQLNKFIQSMVKKRVNVTIVTGACVRLSLYVWGGCPY